VHCSTSTQRELHYNELWYTIPYHEQRDNIRNSRGKTYTRKRGLKEGQKGKKQEGNEEKRKKGKKGKRNQNQHALRAQAESLPTCAIMFTRPPEEN